MQYFVFTSIMLSVLSAFSQHTGITQNAVLDTVYDYSQIDEPPRFAGGAEEQKKFLKAVNSTPVVCKQKDVPDNKLIVELIIENDGTISNAGVAKVFAKK